MVTAQRKLLEDKGRQVLATSAEHQVLQVADGPEATVGMEMYEGHCWTIRVGRMVVVRQEAQAHPPIYQGEEIWQVHYFW